MQQNALTSALQNFRASRQAPAPADAKARAFPVETRMFAAKQQRGAVDHLKAADRRALRKYIRPENAEVLLPHLPECEADRLHALIAGDFVFCDLLAAIIARRGAPRRLVCATLSLSDKNVATLESLVSTHGFPLEILLSHYFTKTSKDIYAALLAVAERSPLVRVRVARSHCKVTLMDYGEAGALVLESSANLRSSRNLEQVSIFNDRGLLEFHAGWIWLKLNAEILQPSLFALVRAESMEKGDDQFIANVFAPREQTNSRRTPGAPPEDRPY